MSASDPPRGESETPRTQQNSRLWGPPTLKRWNRRTMVLTTAAVLFVWFVNELYAQVYLQIALARAADGKYSEALETVQSVKRNVFRRGTAAALQKEAYFYTTLEKSRDAARLQNWFLSGTLLQAARDALPDPEHEARLAETLGDWRGQLDSLLARDEPMACRPCLNSLQSLELGDGLLSDRRRSVVVDTSVRLVEVFRGNGSWTAASEELQRARDLGLEAKRVEELGASLREGLGAAVEEAVATRDYGRAEALTRLLDSLFPSGQKPGSHSVQSVKILEAIHDGEALEEKGDFDGALEAYDRALLLDRGRSESPFHHVAALRERLRGFERDRGQWVPRKSAGSDLVEVSLRYRRWGSFSIPLPENGTSFEAGTLNQYPLSGQWTCSLVGGTEPAWIVRGTVHVDQRSSQPAPSDAKIGFALLGDRRNLLTAETAAVPFLLAGQSHNFELRIPRRTDEKYIAVGVLMRR